MISSGSDDGCWNNGWASHNHPVSSKVPFPNPLGPEGPNAAWSVTTPEGPDVKIPPACPPKNPLGAAEIHAASNAIKI